jgi:hypothetical protein
MGAANRWTSTGGYGWVHHLRMGSRMWPDVARQGLCRSLPHGHRPSVSCVKWPLGESTLGTGIQSGRRNQKVFKKGMGRLWRQKGGCGGWPGCPPWLPCLDLLRLPSLTTLPPSTSPVSLALPLLKQPTQTTIKHQPSVRPCRCRSTTEWLRYLAHTTRLNLHHPWEPGSIPPPPLSSTIHPMLHVAMTHICRASSHEHSIKQVNVKLKMIIWCARNFDESMSCRVKCRRWQLKLLGGCSEWKINLQSSARVAAEIKSSYLKRSRARLVWARSWTRFAVWGVGRVKKNVSAIFFY